MKKPTPLTRVLAYLINAHIFHREAFDAFGLPRDRFLSEWYWHGFMGLADVVWEAMNVAR
jgi:hypothetical protein